MDGAGMVTMTPILNYRYMFFHLILKTHLAHTVPIPFLLSGIDLLLVE